MYNIEQFFYEEDKRMSIPSKILIALGVSGVIFSAVAFLSYRRVSNAVKKGYIKIDLSDKVSKTIRDLAHNQGWLPVKIPLRKLVELKEKKPDTQSFLSRIASYISFEFVEK